MLDFRVGCGCYFQNSFVLNILYNVCVLCMNLVYLVLYVIFGFSCYSRNIKHGYKVIAFVSRFITMEMQDLYVRFWCEIMIDDTS